MPTIIIDKEEKVSARFVSMSGLILDTTLVEKHGAVINSCTFGEIVFFVEMRTSFVWINFVKSPIL
jgi:hypothetical protein